MTDYGNHFDRITRLVHTQFVKVISDCLEFESLKSDLCGYVIKRGQY